MGEARACRTFREGLTEYLEDALPPGKRQGVELHLEGCPSCRALLEQARCTLRATAGLPRAGMPPGMKNALLRAFRRNDAD